MKFSKDTYVNLPFVKYPYATSAIIQRYEKISRNTDKAEIFLDIKEVPLPDGSLFVPHRKSLDNESKVNIYAFKDLPPQILIGVNLEDRDLLRLISKFTQEELIQQTLENFHKLQALIEGEMTKPFCSAIYTPDKDNELKTELIIGIGDGNGTELTWSVPLDLDEEIMLGNEMYRRIDIKTFQKILEDDRIRGDYMKAELNNNVKEIDLKSVSTKELVEELWHGEGVSVTMVEPYDTYTPTISGAAIVLVVED